MAKHRAVVAANPVKKAEAREKRRTRRNNPAAREPRNERLQAKRAHLTNSQREQKNRKRREKYAARPPTKSILEERQKALVTTMSFQCLRMPG